VVVFIVGTFRDDRWGRRRVLRADGIRKLCESHRNTQLHDISSYFRPDDRPAPAMDDFWR
jgi:hypothetical protein